MSIALDNQLRQKEKKKTCRRPLNSLVSPQSIYNVGCLIWVIRYVNLLHIIWYDWQMSLLTINYELLLWYCVYYAGDGLDYSSVYSTSLVCHSVQGDKHFSRGQAARFVTSDPAHCHGGDGSVSCGSADSSPCSEHSALRLATSLCRCFSANLWHPSTELKLTGPWEAGRELDISTDLRGQFGLQGAAAVPSQLVCTILYSPSPCVSPPLSSIATEKPCWCMYLTSVQMHLFEKENETLTYLE